MTNAPSLDDVLESAMEQLLTSVRELEVGKEKLPTVRPSDAEQQPHLESDSSEQLVYATNARAGLSAVHTFKQALCVPAEVLLDAVHCLDFNDLITLMLVTKRFSSVARKLFEQERSTALPITITMSNSSIDVRLWDQWTRLDRQSLILSTELAGNVVCCTGCGICNAIRLVQFENAAVQIRNIIGFHEIIELEIKGILNESWMEYAAAQLPMIRRTESVSIGRGLRGQSVSTDDFRRFLNWFPRLLNFRAFWLGPQFDWKAILRDEKVLSLRRLKLLPVDEAQPDESELLRFISIVANHSAHEEIEVSLDYIPSTACFTKSVCEIVAKASRKISVSVGCAEGALSVVPFVHKQTLTACSGRTIEARVQPDSETFFFHRCTLSSGLTLYVVSNNPEYVACLMKCL